jgi:imidazole glycerol phosphate synthase glutamine amidotransferase subunit
MTRPLRIAVLSLGASNHANICAGLRRAGGDPFAFAAPSDLELAHALVVPGVANVSFLIDALDTAGLRRPLMDAIERGLPTLGICAGFQLLFEASDEAPGRRALGVFAGHVLAMRARTLPHMGWNWVEPLVPDIGGGWGYFAHSFAAPSTARDTVAVSEHGEPFASVARKGNVSGVQFHPERSGAFGAEILGAFVRTAVVRC